MSYLKQFQKGYYNYYPNYREIDNGNINDSEVEKLKNIVISSLDINPYSIVNSMKYPFNIDNKYSFVPSTSSISLSPFPKIDFPIFTNNQLVWFDNGATTHKPASTIDQLKNYYEKYNSNIHRSPHKLSMISSSMFDETRELVASYIGCKTNEIIFVKGTTDGINLLANSLNYTKLAISTMSFIYGNFGTNTIDSNTSSSYNKIIIPKMPLSMCTVLLTNMEHHSNIVPWQLLNQRGMINLEYLIFDKNNNKLNLSELETLLISNPNIKVISVTHVSNVLGITNPIKEISSIVHKYNRILVVDGAQGIPHHKINVKDLDCDAYVFSAHKLFGPTGVGVIYCKEDLYNYMDPYQGGGSMIKEVDLYTSTFQDPPHKFEAGTPNIADVIAFGETIRYLDKLDWSQIASYENELTQHLYKSIRKIPGIEILADTTVDKVPICSFVISGIDDTQLLTELDKSNVAIRYGHHCAQPIIKHYGYTNVYRASLAPYNTIEEIDYFISIIINFISKNK